MCVCFVSGVRVRYITPNLGAAVFRVECVRAFYAHIFCAVIRTCLCVPYALMRIMICV